MHNLDAGGLALVKMPLGIGLAVAVPLSEPSARALMSLKALAGGGGTTFCGVRNCSMLLPRVMRPCLSTPTTVTLYCGGEHVVRWWWSTIPKIQPGPQPRSAGHGQA